MNRYEFVVIVDYDAKDDHAAIHAISESLIRLDGCGRVRFALRNKDTQEKIDINHVLE